MARYRTGASGFLRQTGAVAAGPVEVGQIVEFDGVPSIDMVPLDDAALAAKRTYYLARPRARWLRPTTTGPGHVETLRFAISLGAPAPGLINHTPPAPGLASAVELVAFIESKLGVTP